MDTVLLNHFIVKGEDLSTLCNTLVNFEAVLNDLDTDSIFLAGAMTKTGHGEEIASGMIAGKKYCSCNLTTLKSSPGMTGVKVIILRPSTQLNISQS